MMGDESQFYDAPPHGWTCYHCGENFEATALGQRRARDHFGFSPSDDPACRIKAGDERALLMKLRRTEQSLDALRSSVCAEDTAKDREIAELVSRHAQALRRAEEDGYSKGLADGRAYSKAPPLK